MTRETAIKLFEEKQVRSVWDAGQEKWYISIVDVIGILTDSPNPRKYWSVLKTRLKAEGSQLATNCSQLKMQSADGKFYKTDVADTEQLFRLIQSIPSPKAEPFKLWLAQVASVYDFLRPENKGKKVYVSNGSSCLAAGTQDQLREKIGKQFKDEENGEMCGWAFVMKTMPSIPVD
jgi:hypothetical protein